MEHLWQDCPEFTSDHSAAAQQASEVECAIQLQQPPQPFSELQPSEPQPGMWIQPSHTVFLIYYRSSTEWLTNRKHLCMLKKNKSKNTKHKTATSRSGTNGVQNTMKWGNWMTYLQMSFIVYSDTSLLLQMVPYMSPNSLLISAVWIDTWKKSFISHSVSSNMSSWHLHVKTSRQLGSRPRERE